MTPRFFPRAMLGRAKLGLVALLAAAALMSGLAGSSLRRFEFTRVCMGVQTRIVMYGPEEKAGEKSGEKAAEEAAARAFGRIGELDGEMSDYRVDSELMRLCRGAGGAAVVVSRDLRRVLGEAAETSKLSGGAFDVTVGPASRLWREARRTGSLPSAAERERARVLIDYQAVKIDERDSSVRIARAGMLLDLGGIAKGDAAQQARDLLRGLGFGRAMVALAGDIAVGDPPPGESGWRIAVIGEQGGGAERRLVLTLRNTCVSTSGDTEQFVEIAGRRYSHIVDPRTEVGTPGGVSVTVIDRSGAKADSVATAACVLGAAKGRELLRRAEVLGIVQFVDDGMERVEVVGDARRMGLEGIHR